MLQQKKAFSLEKETQQKKVLKVKRNVRINFPFFKQTSHYNVYGSEGMHIIIEEKGFFKSDDP